MDLCRYCGDPWRWGGISLRGGEREPGWGIDSRAYVVGNGEASSDIPCPVDIPTTVSY
ncbi:hypothetical protein A2U01_0053126 [Trifolium medium]|uniref:Uncharacterized protein n=1 Tax=Trifolium medium TaxID=97028 RepID=A0A392R745_9FABA|nr:hypothetical protein [Trifolium medium]